MLEKIWGLLYVQSQIVPLEIINITDTDLILSLSGGFCKSIIQKMQ